MKKLMEFDQILSNFVYSDLGWDFYVSIYQIYNRIVALIVIWLSSPLNVSAYALTLTRSSIRLLCVSFCKYTTQLWPLVVVRISFPLNILWKIDEIWSNFAYTLTLIKSRLGLLSINFCLFTTYYHQNLFSAQYFENKLMKLNQILHMLWCWSDLSRDYYTSISAGIQHNYGPWFVSEFCFSSVSCEPVDGICLKLCICIDLNQTYVGIATCQFLQTY